MGVHFLVPSSSERRLHASARGHFLHPQLQQWLPESSHRVPLTCFHCHMSSNSDLRLPLPPVRTLVITVGPPDHPGSSLYDQLISNSVPSATFMSLCHVTFSHRCRGLGAGLARLWGPIILPTAQRVAGLQWSLNPQPRYVFCTQDRALLGNKGTPRQGGESGWRRSRPSNPRAPEL